MGLFAVWNSHRGCVVAAPPTAAAVPNTTYEARFFFQKINISKSMRFLSQFSHLTEVLGKNINIYNIKNLTKSTIRYVLVVDLKDVNISLYDVSQS